VWIKHIEKRDKLHRKVRQINLYLDLPNLTLRQDIENRIEINSTGFGTVFNPCKTAKACGLEQPLRAFCAEIAPIQGEILSTRTIPLPVCRAELKSFSVSSGVRF
jgi:hypothetical protein